MVSVAGCLGYDVLEYGLGCWTLLARVSVAGCLGYDVLAIGYVSLLAIRAVSP